jgi:hypothetical protein
MEERGGLRRTRLGAVNLVERLDEGARGLAADAVGGREFLWNASMEERGDLRRTRLGAVNSCGTPRWRSEGEAWALPADGAPGRRTCGPAATAPRFSVGILALRARSTPKRRLQSPTLPPLSAPGEEHGGTPRSITHAPHLSALWSEKGLRNAACSRPRPRPPLRAPGEEHGEYRLPGGENAALASTKRPRG